MSSTLTSLFMDNGDECNSNYVSDLELEVEQHLKDILLIESCMINENNTKIHDELQQFLIEKLECLHLIQENNKNIKQHTNLILFNNFDKTSPLYCYETLDDSI